MGTQTTVTLIDDLDGSESVESISFAIDGGDLRDRPQREECQETSGRRRQVRRPCQNRDQGGRVS